ncbi:MAG TPA: SusC/RagA family TonB-linked outer membrane protein [Chitinophagaceae bacterium]|nr:SusC/RagA family TonB-linked outer membrane protein [Chitinophagaceae bacterium]
MPLLAVGQEHSLGRRTHPRLIRAIRTILLFGISLLLAWQLAAQEITLNLHNVPLERVLKEIQAQSPYRFVYTTEMMEKASPVTVSVNHAPVEATLAQSFKGQPLEYTIEDRMVVINYREIRKDSPVPATVKGKVTNANGDPLAGATVSVRGTSRAAITDDQGLFTLESVEKGAILVISSVGYETTEKKWLGQDLLLIVLNQKVASLQEVVVNTGYQDLPRERATGSFVKVDQATLNEQVGSNVLDRLDGVASGLLFNRSFQAAPGQKKLNLQIRGLSTINGPLDPLVILDNFPYEGDINNINPNDIESVTVLKDAAATSIWGTRAGNGVIVLTSKKAKINQPLSLVFSSNLSITDKPNLRKVQDMPAADYVEVEKFLFANQFRFSDTSSSVHPPFSPVYEVLFNEMNGTMSASQAQAMLDHLSKSDLREEFKRWMYRVTPTQRYGLTLRGSSDRSGWLVSTGLDRDLDNLDASFTRYNLRLENQIQPAKGLQIQTSALYTKSRNVTGRPGYGQVQGYRNGIPGYTQFADADGNPLPLIKNYRASFLDTLGAGRLLDWNYYPLTDWKFNRTTQRLEDVLLNLGVSYKFLRIFQAQVKYQYERQSIDGIADHTLESFFTRDMINTFSQIDYTSGKVVHPVPLGGIQDWNRSLLVSQALRAQLDFTRQWKSNNLNGIVGAEIRNAETQENYNRIYGFDPDNLTISYVDYTHTYPRMVNAGSSYIPTTLRESGFYNRNVSLFANASYSLHDRYILTASARRDGSNLFGVTTNNKWKPLWSTGLAWKVSKESFYHIKWLPTLALRATYGYSGNADPSQSAQTVISYSSVSLYTNSPIAVVRKYGNPGLRWEKVGQLNLGMDFSFLHQRVSGSLEWYRKRASDLLAEVPLDYTAGLNRTSITRNAGSLRTTGWDLQINTVNVDRELTWRTSLLLSLNKDRITNYYYKKSALAMVGGGVAGIVGHAAYGLYSYPWAGLDPANGDPQGYFESKISKDYVTILNNTKPEDMIYQGSVLPTVFGSLQNSVTWKGITLTALFSCRLNYWFRRNSIQYSNLFYNNMGNIDYEKRWQKPGDETNTSVQSMQYPVNANRDAFYANAAELARNASNIRLQFVSVSYDINPRYLEKWKVRDFQVYVNASNLGLLWTANPERIDPDNEYFPPARVFSIGLKLGL